MQTDHVTIERNIFVSMDLLEYKSDDSYVNEESEDSANEDYHINDDMSCNRSNDVSSELFPTTIFKFVAAGLSYVNGYQGHICSYDGDDEAEVKNVLIDIVNEVLERHETHMIKFESSPRKAYNSVKFRRPYYSTIFHRDDESTEIDGSCRGKDDLSGDGSARSFRSAMLRSDISSARSDVNSANSHSSRAQNSVINYHYTFTSHSEGSSVENIPIWSYGNRPPRYLSKSFPKREYYLAPTPGQYLISSHEMMHEISHVSKIHINKKIIRRKTRFRKKMMQKKKQKFDAQLQKNLDLQSKIVDHDTLVRSYFNRVSHREQSAENARR
jgi:hypothetical protein